MSSAAQLFAALDRWLPRAVLLRHQIHRHPNLSGDESATRDRVLAALPPGTTHQGVAGTGAVVRVGGPGPAIALRGEMDALPVVEGTGAEWSSQNPGVMHSCGHDVHLAALTAVANALADSGPPAPVVAVLQPREETYPSGAKDICSSGALEDQRCVAVIGAHIQPQLEPHQVACTAGPVNASADEFRIRVRGTAGHAAYPHLSHDALVTLAHIIVAAQTIVSRSVDPMTPAVVGVSSMSSGTAANVMAGQASATGTIRTLEPQTRRLLRQRLREVVHSTATAHRCTAELDITSGEPVLHNDRELVARIGPLLAEQGFVTIDGVRSLGSDDFSYFSDLLPAVMLFVGSDSAEQLHSPAFLPSDDDVGRVARAMMSGYLGAATTIPAG